MELKPSDPLTTSSHTLVHMSAVGACHKPLFDPLRSRSRCHPLLKTFSMILYSADRARLSASATFRHTVTVEEQ